MSIRISRTIPGIIVRYQRREGRRRDVITVAADEGQKKGRFRDLILCNATGIIR
ncbi:TPA: hypothetical protein SBQ34_003800 [Raoultella ornithinolytica]|uniref:Uncharacterized protein n=1 Tax=Raoultella ornithinolytica TaxID=54291 RepID=A0A9Q9N2N8_RAOOR|nr:MULTISPECIES: hypothetical protein [Raoultella]EKV0505573.1 hypothetical protein [Raoultella ornithinolytica]ELS0895746.1 hypothetical protein [Raoultella ornithinolytica]ELS1883996.1 hypothetical protein [Raoultella ornithinolytica]ELS5398920.1 hypothetical protein [Raoultella ornithinolytica]ELS5453968.1 hypothetical protein [Raoultella ornithinolytica]